MLTHDIDGIGRAGDAIWIVLDDIGSLENSLDGAGFDIELVVAEAILPECLISLVKLAACKVHDMAQGGYLSSGEKFQSVTAP